MAIAALALPALLGAGSAAGAAGAGAVGMTAAALSTAGAVGSAVGSIQNGLYSAQVAKNNAKIAQNNEVQSIQAGDIQAQDQGLKNAAQLGQLKADQAANQVDVNSGSALAVDQSADASGKMDQATIMHNALLAAYGYRQAAVSDKAQGGQDATAGYEQAAGGLLQNASALNYKWMLPGAAGAAGDGLKVTPNGTPTGG